METIGARLKRLRVARDLKVVDAAKEVGITIQAWTDYEKDRTAPQLDKLVRICRFFNVSCDYIVFGREHEFDPPTITDDYSSYLECLTRLLCDGVLQFKTIENGLGDAVFVSSDDYVKLFTLEYTRFVERNRDCLSHEEVQKMTKVLTEKYKVTIKKGRL